MKLVYMFFVIIIALTMQIVPLHADPYAQMEAIGIDLIKGKFVNRKLLAQRLVSIATLGVKEDNVLDADPCCLHATHNISSERASAAETRLNFRALMLGAKILATYSQRDDAEDYRALYHDRVLLFFQKYFYRSGCIHYDDANDEYTRHVPHVDDDQRTHIIMAMMIFDKAYGLCDKRVKSVDYDFYRKLLLCNRIPLVIGNDALEDFLETLNGHGSHGHDSFNQLWNEILSDCGEVTDKNQTAALNHLIPLAGEVSDKYQAASSNLLIPLAYEWMSTPAAESYIKDLCKGRSHRFHVRINDIWGPFVGLCRCYHELKLKAATRDPYWLFEFAMLETELFGIDPNSKVQKLKASILELTLDFKTYKLVKKR